MTNIQKWILGIVAGITVMLLFAVASLSNSGSKASLGSIYNQVTKYFYDGINVGTNSQFTVTGAGVVTSTGALTTSSSVLSSSASAGIGYTTGAGCAVTQATSRTTGVTCTGLSGAITLVSGAGSTTPASFTVTNTSVSATDMVNVSQKSGTDLYEIFVTNTGSGSFKVTYFTTGGTTTEQPVFNFSVTKGVSS